MADMHVLSFGRLLDWVLDEFEAHQSIFGIPRSLFYVPRRDVPYEIDDLFGQRLSTPVGPAAGPHTQLAQNILCAWLSGARFIELKTVQVMDELDIPRPCIDMADEGYNVEWSQELKLEQSADEYANAWIMVHVLRRLLGFEGVPFGTILNMSVGYDLEGIQSPPMQRFIDRLIDGSEAIDPIREILRQQYPQFADLEIPAQITNNVTLSTMHGCPPDEIERIGRYLLEERGLHTTIKLNPTLLGRDPLLEILHGRLGFEEIHIPDAVFEHDLGYDRALALIGSLKQVAADRGLVFGVKLSNTLAMANHRQVLPGDEMYMSGRALYPIAMNLFRKLAADLGGDVNVSYSAGADAGNVTAVLAAGARPVTIASDLLKPGGYSRLLQVLENLERDMQQRGASSLTALSADRLDNLARAADEALHDPRYKKDYFSHGLPKVASGLGLFDCVEAPCVAQCAVHQDVPEYVWLIRQQRYDEALAVILARNPLPGVTGHVCTHLCQTRCTRNNYDQPVAIRALKRFAVEHGRAEAVAKEMSRHRVAVIGSGPSGLAAAYFLALNGVRVTIYEEKDRVGGMLALAPVFRLPQAVVQEDVDRIVGLGVEVVLNHPVEGPPERLLDEGFDAVYIASGAQRGVRLGVEGENGAGVTQALDFLAAVRRSEPVDLGDRVLVIGGGNSAMDAARTAKRLVEGDVTVVYRRTRREMPATEEELTGLLAEGVLLEELASPVRIVLEEDRVVGLVCVRNRLGAPGDDGRRRPEPVAESAFTIPADAVILAIGQRPDVAFLQESAVCLLQRDTIAVDAPTGLACGEAVYAGGDAVRGPAIIIEACEDGRRAAQAILRQLSLEMTQPNVQLPVLSAEEIAAVKRVRARRAAQNRAPLLPLDRRDGFDLIEATLTEAQALDEAARCMQCTTLCDKCVEVCPNRANWVVLVEPVHLTVPQLAHQDGGLQVVGEQRWAVEQSRQIVHLEDLCNECGNCATFCVHEGRPYVDKPRLYLRREDFESELDNAFFVSRDGDRWTIWRRAEGRSSHLTRNGDGTASFEDDDIRIVIREERFDVVEMDAVRSFDGVRDLSGAAEMMVLLSGIQTGLSFLPFAEEA